MGIETPQGTLMDRAKADALAYLDALPSEDRVMLVRADAIATPATAFESNRTLVAEAIRGSNAGASSLDLGNALSYAERAQQVQARQSGEIVFIGAGHVAGEVPLEALPGNLRVISSLAAGASSRAAGASSLAAGAATDATTDNVGFRKVGLQRSLEQPDTWDIYVSVQNYSDQPRAVDMALQYAMSPVGSRRLTLAAGEQQETTFTYTEKVGGTLEARLNVNDSFPGDDAVFVELPTRSFARIQVYSDDPALLRPLLNSNQYVEAEFFRSPLTAPSTRGWSRRKPEATEPVTASSLTDSFPPNFPTPTRSLFNRPPPVRRLRSPPRPPAPRWSAGTTKPRSPRACSRATSHSTTRESSRRPKATS